MTCKRVLETYRGFEIERHHSGPWDVTYQWSKAGWDLGDPMGYEPSIEACKRAINDHLECDCTGCRDTGLVRLDPFEPEMAPCPDCNPLKVARGIGVGVLTCAPLWLAAALFLMGRE